MDRLQLRVDVLVLNLQLQGAIAFIDGIRQSRIAVKIIALVEGVDVKAAPGVDLLRRKPDHIDGSSASEWLEVLHSVAGAYRGNGGAK